MVFLPEDNKDLSSPATQSVLSAINDDLCKLLQSPAAQFWDVVKNDPSLHACLDSFLRFKRYEAPTCTQLLDLHNSADLPHCIWLAAGLDA
jgi:hypothetical protein